MSRSLAANFGSLDSLNCRIRCGCRPCARQMRCTELSADARRPWPWLPRSSASSRPADRPSVSATTRSAISGGSGGDARRAGLVAQQPVHASSHEALLPAPDSGLGLDPCVRMISAVPHAIRRGQHDPGAPDMLLRAVAVINDRPQSLTISWAQMDDNTSAHPADSHDAARNPNPDSLSRSIH